MPETSHGNITLNTDGSNFECTDFLRFYASFVQHPVFMVFGCASFWQLFISGRMFAERMMQVCGVPKLLGKPFVYVI